MECLNAQSNKKNAEELSLPGMKVKADYEMFSNSMIRVNGCSLYIK